MVVFYTHGTVWYDLTSDLSYGISMKLISVCVCVGIEFDAYIFLHSDTN